MVSVVAEVLKAVAVGRGGEAKWEAGPGTGGRD